MRKRKLPVPSTSSSSSSGGGSDQLVKLMAMDEETDQVLIPLSIPQEIQLVSGYRSEIPKFEEFAMEFVSNTANHPVISCFRDLSGPDVTHIISNLTKLKKRMANLELGVTYLGLIDYLAFSVDNPLSAKINNVPGKVQKLMMEFKNIIGSWGLSEKELFKDRYNLVMKYLRKIVPRFQFIGFAETFGKILDAIEREVAKTKQNSEMIKALSNPSVVKSQNKNDTACANGTVTSPSETITLIDAEEDNPQKIELDISMDIDDNLDDDDDDKNEVKSNFRPVQTSINSFFGGENSASKQQSGSGASSSPIPKLNFAETERKRKTPLKRAENKTKKLVTPKMENHSVPQKSTSTVSQPLPSVEISNIDPMKIAKEEESSARKRPRLEIDSENVENQANPDCQPVPQPKVNAFALLMNRSKELAHQSKLKKMNPNKSTLKSSVNNNS